MRRSDAMWVGAVVGGLFGLVLAYLLSPPAEPRDPSERGPSFLAKAGPADALAIGQIAWTLVRRVQHIRLREGLVR